MLRPGRKTFSRSRFQGNGLSAEMLITPEATPGPRRQGSAMELLCAPLIQKAPPGHKYQQFHASGVSKVAAASVTFQLPASAGRSKRLRRKGSSEIGRNFASSVNLLLGLTRS